MTTGNTNTLTLPIIGMHCAGCASSVERNAQNVATVQSAAVNLATERLTVE